MLSQGWTTSIPVSSHPPSRCVQNKGDCTPTNRPRSSPSFPVFFLSFQWTTMDDGGLRSLCIEKESYYTFNQQQEALISPGPQRIFRDRNTYVHMVIPVLTHWVAVQVTISPFTLQQYPGQTFFSSKFRYGPCCCQINQSHASIVTNTVQKVIDYFYQSFSWDYSSAE
jgi:hypothetical protein